MKFIRTTLPFVIACFGVVFTMSAQAQYMWLDASGRKVFSDQPPPITVPNKNIKKQPNNTASASAANPEATATAATDASAATPAKSESPASTSTTTANKAAEGKPSTTATTAKDKDLEAAKKKLDDEAAAKKKAEQEKVDIAKAENCKRAKSSKATLDSGMRLAHTNDKGERGFMDDASRMVETKRLEGIMATDCK
jgi:type IV secretory pathway VirB10-like protein